VKITKRHIGVAIVALFAVATTQLATAVPAMATANTCPEGTAPGERVKLSRDYHDTADVLAHQKGAKGAGSFTQEGTGWFTKGTFVHFCLPVESSKVMKSSASTPTTAKPTPNTTAHKNPGGDKQPKERVVELSGIRSYDWSSLIAEIYRQFGQPSGNGYVVRWDVGNGPKLQNGETFGKKLRLRVPPGSVVFVSQWRSGGYSTPYGLIGDPDARYEHFKQLLGPMNSSALGVLSWLTKDRAGGQFKFADDEVVQFMRTFQGDNSGLDDTPSTTAARDVPAINTPYVSLGRPEKDWLEENYGSGMSCGAGGCPDIGGSTPKDKCAGMCGHKDDSTKNPDPCAGIPCGGDIGILDRSCGEGGCVVADPKPDPNPCGPDGCKGLDGIVTSGAG
jgi:hypothetical protein